MYFVYVLKSLSRNYIYVGMTDYLERRIGEHQSGKNKTTKPYRPFALIYSENFFNKRRSRKKREIFEVRCRKGISLKNNLLNCRMAKPACRQAGW
jgi:putative endonuclease